MLFRFLILVNVCAAFPLKCPEPAQWSIRARSHCQDPSKYSCLENDLINGYSENCTLFDFLHPGRKNILRGGLDADFCSIERYQPIKFYTNVSTNCVLLKSMCNEEGQVEYDSGNKKNDISCSCDYTRGYDFLVEPQIPCFCTPSKEDCSCYLKSSKDSTNLISPDNKSIHTQRNKMMNQCKPIINHRINKEANKSGTVNTVREQHISISEEYRMAVVLLVASCLSLVIFLSIPVAVFLNIIATTARYQYKENITFSNAELTIEPMELFEGTAISISCEIKRTYKSLIWSKDGNFLCPSDNIECNVNGMQHTLFIHKAELSDSGKYCITVDGIKKEIYLEVIAFFVENLSSDTKNQEEGDDITLRCKTVNTNCKQTVVQWFKDGQPVKITNRLYTENNKRRHFLVIRNSNIYDSGDYSINVNGNERSLHLDVKANNIPLEIQKMNEAEKAKYIKILKEGKEKRYHIKIMLLGRRGVGKTSLMKRLLHEPMCDVKSTDGIDIVKKCKIDIESGEWIFCEGETTDERIGKAIRKKDDTESTDQLKIPVNAQLLDSKTLTNSYDSIGQYTQIERDKTTNERFDQVLRKEDDQGSIDTTQIQECVVKDNSHNKPQPRIEDTSAHHIPIGKGETTDERIGKAIRKKDDIESTDQLKIPVNAQLLDSKTLTNSHDSIGQYTQIERGLRQQAYDYLKDLTGPIMFYFRGKGETTDEQTGIPGGEQIKPISTDEDENDSESIDAYSTQNTVLKEIRKTKAQQQDTSTHHISMDEGIPRGEHIKLILTDEAENNSECFDAYSTQNTVLKEIRKTKTQQQDTLTHHISMDEVKERSKNVSNPMSKASTFYEKDKLNIKDSTNEHRHEGDFDVTLSGLVNTTEQRNIVQEEPDNIETVLEIGCNARVPQKEYADCTFMDFAGHNEYYSTHQTFLTRHAIYLVVFSLKDENPFTETNDETEQISFWIDNIHCYASPKQHTEQDTKAGGLNPPIVMVCTGEDTEENQQLFAIKKKEWKDKFITLLGSNQRHSHIIGEINYISNTLHSEEAFQRLRGLIFRIAKDAKDMSVWGHYYPVRWINLERAMNKLRHHGKHVLEFHTIMEEAKKGPVSITSNEEVILFLQFQHEIGNLIFYNDRGLDNCIVIKPTWLIDAFKCIICANEFQPFSTRCHPKALQIFAERGIISSELCYDLFKEKSKEHAENSEFVLRVMEKFDIIVKDKLNRKSIVCPSAIKKKSSTFEEICNKNSIVEGKCSRSPWLCIEFDFLPPALYNNLLVLFMRDIYFEKPQLFHETGIFCIKGSNELDKLVLCKSQKTILVQKIQIRSKPEDERLSGELIATTTNGHDLLKDIKSKIKDITNKYEIKLEYKCSVKCADVPYNSQGDSYYHEDIKMKASGLCHFHCKPHDLQKMFRFWFVMSNREILPIQMTLESIDHVILKGFGQDHFTNPKRECCTCNRLSVYSMCVTCEKRCCIICSEAHATSYKLHDICKDEQFYRLQHDQAKDHNKRNNEPCSSCRREYATAFCANCADIYCLSCIEIHTENYKCHNICKDGHYLDRVIQKDNYGQCHTCSCQCDGYAFCASCENMYCYMCSKAHLKYYKSHFMFDKEHFYVCKSDVKCKFCSHERATEVCEKCCLVLCIDCASVHNHKSLQFE